MFKQHGSDYLYYLRHRAEFLSYMLPNGGHHLCGRLPDIFKTGIFPLTQDFDNCIYREAAEWIFIVYTVSCSSLCPKCFLHNIFGYVDCYYLNIFRALLGITIVYLFDLVRLVLSEPVAELCLTVCVIDSLTP